MAVRIEGIIIPNEKRVEAALCYIHGIGLHSSQIILSKAGVSPDVRVKDLVSKDIAAIQKIIAEEYVVEGDLRKEVMLNINRLRDIGCYRGIRHKRSLPVRGQRTKTNARTRKGVNRSKKSAFAKS